MPILLTDSDIRSLLAERKQLSADFRRQLRLKPKRGHREANLNVTGVGGSEFSLILRQSEVDNLNYSVILAYNIPRSNKLFRLCRYNGKHWHTNRLERQSFYDFHIHQATERYQEVGLREDTFAEPTNRYSNIHEALDCLIQDCGFDLPTVS